MINIFFDHVCWYFFHSLFFRNINGPAWKILEECGLHLTCLFACYFMSHWLHGTRKRVSHAYCKVVYGASSVKAWGCLLQWRARQKEERWLARAGLVSACIVLFLRWCCTKQFWTAIFNMLHETRQLSTQHLCGNGWQRHVTQDIFKATLLARYGYRSFQSPTLTCSFHVNDEGVTRSNLQHRGSNVLWVFEDSLKTCNTLPRKMLRWSCRRSMLHGAF